MPSCWHHLVGVVAVALCRPTVTNPVTPGRPGPAATPTHRPLPLPSNFTHRGSAACPGPALCESCPISFRVSPHQGFTQTFWFRALAATPPRSFRLLHTPNVAPHGDDATFAVLLHITLCTAPPLCHGSKSSPLSAPCDPASLGLLIFVTWPALICSLRVPDAMCARCLPILPRWAPSPIRLYCGPASARS